LAVLSLAFVVSSARSRATHGWLPFLGVALGTWVAVAAAGHFFPHYYQLWLPLLAIGGGAAISRFAGVPDRSAAVKAGARRQVVAWAAGLGALALLLGHSLPQFRQPADRWPALKYPHDGVVFSEIPRVAERVNGLLLPGESFFHWGTDPGLYFYSGRRPPTLVTFCNPLFAGPLAEELGNVTLSQLKAAPPELAIVRRVFLDVRPVAPVLAWILENYRPLPGDATLAFDLFALRGGALEARIRNGSQ
jgi:hypothetical protein